MAVKFYKHILKTIHNHACDCILSCNTHSVGFLKSVFGVMVLLEETNGSFYSTFFTSVNKRDCHEMEIT